MPALIVPVDNSKDWPSLGPEVAAWMREWLVHGPGDLRGEPYRLDAEKEWLLRRLYEVFPEGHARAGRRRFRRSAISLRKGSAKTEFAAAIAIAELSEDGPVRCVEWEDGIGGRVPVGGPVTDPYIPLIASTEEQSSELAFEAMRVMINDGRLNNRFRVFLDRIEREDGSGRAVSVAAAPRARDGARTTFQIADESHRLTLPSQREAWRVMIANTMKRKVADPWSLETTTSYGPGEQSVAESTFEYAHSLKDKEASDTTMFFFHRDASQKHDIEDPGELRDAIVEASGPVAGWSDIEGIASLFADPTNDVTLLRRLWLNQVVRGAARAFDVEKWKGLVEPVPISRGSLVCLGFDGAVRRDSTALVACEVDTGKLELIGLWERPVNAEDEWEIDRNVVDQAVRAAFEHYDVWRLYADPPYWESYIDAWSGEYGDKRVIHWWTNRWRPVSYAVRAFTSALDAGELSHTGDDDLTRHIGNAVRRETNIRDDEDRPLWSICKERPDSPKKMDAGMAAVLAFEARGDAVAAGVRRRVKWLV